MMVYKRFENYTSIVSNQPLKVCIWHQYNLKIRGGAFHVTDNNNNNTPVLSKKHTYAQLEPIGKTSSALLDQAEVWGKTFSFKNI